MIRGSWMSKRRLVFQLYNSRVWDLWIYCFMPINALYNYSRGLITSCPIYDYPLTFFFFILCLPSLITLCVSSQFSSSSNINVHAASQSTLKYILPKVCLFHPIGLVRGFQTSAEIVKLWPIFKSSEMPHSSFLISHSSSG